MSGWAWRLSGAGKEACLGGESGLECPFGGGRQPVREEARNMMERNRASLDTGFIAAIRVHHPACVKVGGQNAPAISLYGIPAKRV